MNLASVTIKLTAAACALGMLAFHFVPARQSVTAISSRPYIKAVYSSHLSLDPAQIDDTASLLVANLIYDGLLSFTANLELSGALAETWSTSRDGKTLHFKLRKNAKFQNGELVTAYDVENSLKRVVAPNSKVYSYYDCIQGADAFHAGTAENVTGLKVINPSEIKIVLKYAFPPFLSVLAGATAKVLPSNADQPGFFKSPIGSGPFKYAGLKKNGINTDTILNRFDDYYGVRPKLSQMILRATTEENAVAEAKAGHIDDLANFPLSGTEDIFNYGQEITAPVAATWIIGLNSRLPPFNNPEVRRAFRDSIDTNRFRVTFHPDAIQANGYIPPGLPGFQHSYRKESNASPRKASSKLIRIAIPEALARVQEMKLFFEKSLKLYGWKVEVVPMPWDKMMKGYSDKTLQAFLVSMNMDYPDTEFLVRNFESSNVDSFSGLKDSKVDTLIRKARMTQDRVQRQKIYVELDQPGEFVPPTMLTISRQAVS